MGAADSESIPSDKPAFERERLRLERQKLALDVRLRRRELEIRLKQSQVVDRPSVWREILTNPLSLAIAGGLLTLMTQIITSTFNTQAQLRAMQLAQQNAERSFQAELIKKFVEAPDLSAARGNLEFLIEAGLLPEYENKIREYLNKNPGTAPQIGSGSGFHLSNVKLRDIPDDSFFSGIGQLEVNGKVVCTAFLIAEQVIVTAVYCIPAKQGDEVRSGSFVPFRPKNVKNGAKQVVGVPLDLSKNVKLMNGTLGVIVVGLIAPVTDLPYPRLSRTRAVFPTNFKVGFYDGGLKDYATFPGSCHMLANDANGNLIHSCDGPPGSAGAPLLAGNGTAIGVYAASGQAANSVPSDIIRQNADVLRIFGELP